MRHLIERVLELTEEEQRVVHTEDAPTMGTEEEPVSYTHLTLPTSCCV